MRVRSFVVLALLLIAQLAAAQSTEVGRRAPGVTVSGVVRDSIAGTTLAGAIVQLVSRDSTASEARTTISDARGRFAFDSVAPGHYALGFFHPVLDSLGLESATRELAIEGGRAVHADVAIPPPARVRAAICGPRVVSPSDAVVVGFVRDARTGAPAANANVTAEWLEIAIKRGGIGSRVPRLVATTSDRGWFALCNVPSPGTILITASRGMDSTDLLELTVPSSGLLRRELFLGAARTAIAIDTFTNSTRRLHVGDGHLSGTVVNATDGVPIVGALVGIADGLQARTNELGEWTLSNAPAGTRMLEVRALGFYPQRRAVDVLEGTTPLRLTLSTMRSVLDTVKVNANRLADRDLAEFDQRRRTGFGRYLTADDIARRRPTFTSDLFRAMPGVRLERANINLGGATLAMRATVGDLCAPSIYIDGHYLAELTADDLDAFVQPSEIIGVEVYPSGTAPMEFQHGLSGCGSIVIWTNLASAGDRPKLTKARIVTGLVVGAVSLLTSFLLFRH